MYEKSKINLKKIMIGLAVLLVVLLIIVLISWNVMFGMPGGSYSGQLPPMTDTEQAVRGQLERDVQILAGDIGIRYVLPVIKAAMDETRTAIPVYETNLNKAAEFIEAEFRGAGYKPLRIDFLVQDSLGKSRTIPVYNIEVEIPGTSGSNETIVIGAHYDSVHYTPGANDNASGVAAMLALARAFAGKSIPINLRFVAFVNEEPPFFQTEDMGSMVYARACRDGSENIAGMISLETIGYYSDKEGSQAYPFPFNLVYPSTGNFIAFVGNVASRDLVRTSIGAFRRTTQFPSEGGALPGMIPGIGWSDHWSFWQVNYPAIMVTDTAPFRYPHYHSPEDTPDKIDYERMSRVVVGLGHVVAELVEYEGEIWGQ